MNGIVPNTERRSGALVLLGAAAAGLAIAIFNYFWRGNGIHGTGGALLVVVSSALMVAAAGALGFIHGMARGLRSTLVVLIALDIVGTGLAAYFLEATWLIAAMAVALLAWVMQLASGRTSRQSPASMAERGMP